MNTEKRDFDKDAASWDDKPGRVKLANNVALVISKQITLTHEMDIMDFGCGTGLLTFQLQPLVRSITGVDSSPGMLDVLKTKISKLGLNNVTAMLADLDRGDKLAGKYDAVVSNMTLHHIKEIEPLLAQFYDITEPGGYLCIADLDLDGGQFHEDNTGVFHCGFDRACLRDVFIKAGYDDVRDTTAAEVIKPNANGEMKRFSIFLMIGRKKIS